MFVLAGGRRSPNPAEILAGPFFGRLIAEAATLFDRVVIDSAPILAVSDTLLMTPHVQTVCIVVRASKTPRQRSAARLPCSQSQEFVQPGLVLNRLRRSRGVGYYYYYASHGYGEEEGAYSRGSYDRTSSRITKVTARRAAGTTAPLNSRVPTRAVSARSVVRNAWFFQSMLPQQRPRYVATYSWIDSI